MNFAPIAGTVTAGTYGSVTITANESKAVNALAIVATPDQTGLFARLLGALAAADRRMRVFDSLRQARGWLESQADPDDRKDPGKAQAATSPRADPEAS